MEQWENDLQSALEKDERQSELEEENLRLRTKLEAVAVILARNGIIHDTPGSKKEWVES